MPPGQYAEKTYFFRALMLLRDARPRRNTQHSLLTSFVINVAKVARYQRRQRYNSRNALPRSLLLAPCWGSNRPIEVLHNSALIRPLEELLEMQYVSRRTRFFYSRSPQNLLSGSFWRPKFPRKSEQILEVGAVSSLLGSDRPIESLLLAILVVSTG